MIGDESELASEQKLPELAEAEYDSESFSLNLRVVTLSGRERARSESDRAFRSIRVGVEQSG